MTFDQFMLLIAMVVGVTAAIAYIVGWYGGFNEGVRFVPEWCAICGYKATCVECLRRKGGHTHAEFAIKHALAHRKTIDIGKVVT